MRIHYRTEGGFAYIPGLGRSVDIDTAGLSARQAESIEAAVHDCDFFHLPTEIGAPSKGAADYRVYIVTVEDGADQHTVKVPEVTDSAHLKKLIAALRSIKAP